MHLDDLRYVGQYIATRAQELSVDGLFETVASQLHAAAQGGQADVVSNMERLQEALRRMTLPNASPARHEAWLLFGADRVFGNEAAQHLAAGLLTNAGNFAKTREFVVKMRNQALLVAGAARLVGDRAEGLLKAQGYVAPKTGVVSMTYRGGASIDTLSALAEQADELDQAFKTFAEIGGAPAESPRLQNLERGSLIVDVLLAPTTYEVLRDVALPLAQGLLTIIELKKALRDLQRLGVPEAIPTVAAQTEAKIDTLASETAESVLAAHGIKEPEMQGRTKRAVKYFAAVLSSGSELRFLPADGATDLEAIAEVNSLLHSVTTAGRLAEGPDVKALPRDEDAT